MIQQIRYFQSIVRNNSFSKAAEECHISQSAISQQIQALERALGFQLLERQHRKFFLTPAGELFYRKSLILISDFENICREAAKIAREEEAVLKIGYLRCYTGNEFHRAVEQFYTKYPEIQVVIEYGNHEELYELLRTDGVDLVLNDQRRAFSDEYVNEIVAEMGCYIEVSSKSPLASLEKIMPGELKNTPCIIVASEAQRETEREFYQTVVGFQGEYLYADNLEAARLLVIGGKGFLPIEGKKKTADFGISLTRIPLVRNGKHITRNYGVFWKQENSGYYVEEFADMLKAQFVQQ